MVRRGAVVVVCGVVGVVVSDMSRLILVFRHCNNFTRDAPKMVINL